MPPRRGKEARSGANAFDRLDTIDGENDGESVEEFEKCDVGSVRQEECADGDVSWKGRMEVVARGKSGSETGFVDEGNVVGRVRRV